MLADVVQRVDCLVCCRPLSFTALKFADLAVVLEDNIRDNDLFNDDNADDDDLDPNIDDNDFDPNVDDNALIAGVNGKNDEDNSNVDDTIEK